MADPKLCSVTDCDKAVLARGLCAMHYSRMRQHGDPLLGAKKAPIVGCSVAGCEKPHLSRGYCDKHWARWRKYGDPTVGVRTEYGKPGRYFRETVLTYEGDECLPWPYTRNRQGYGQLRQNGKTILVTRLACEAANGPPPSPHHQAAHSCGKGHTGCCTKRHLSWKTHAANHDDRWEHGTMLVGDQCAGAKLNEAKVREIRLLDGKCRAKDLAERYGVSQMTIYDIRHRRSWAWLD